jgi:LysM repeat protein
MMNIFVMRRIFKRSLFFLDPYFRFWEIGLEMKAYFRHLAWICVLLFGNISGQGATYTVKPGDSLSKIARSQGCTVEALAKANGIKLSALIQAGQTLKLPGSKVTAAASSAGSHTIQPGDTFSSISRQYNVSVESLLAANPGLDPKSLRPGQKIHLSDTKQSIASKAESPREPVPAQPAGAPENSVSTTAKHQSPDSTPEPPSAPTPQPLEEKVRTVMVEAEMTFGEFASQHGSDINRLNELNGLDLTAATVLAKGSELYVPVQVRTEP